MKVWLINFTTCGIKLDAVVVHESGGAAVAMLKLGADSRLYEVEKIGEATENFTPRIVTEDKLT